MGPTVGVFDRSEQKREEMSFIRSVMQVETEFWTQLKLGDEPHTVLNDLLVDVQRTMRADINTAEPDGTCLTINITERQNEFDVEGPGDSVVGAVIVWEIIYRHQVLDSRKLLGET